MTEFSNWLTTDQERAWHDFQRMQMQLNAALSRQLARDSHLSGADYAVLVALADRDDHKMRSFELARELGWEKSRLSHHLARMDKRGLVTWEDCPADGRGSFIVISDLGRDVLEGAAPGHVEAVRSLCVDMLSDEQIAQLGEICHVVLEHLTAVEEPSA